MRARPLMAAAAACAVAWCGPVADPVPLAWRDEPARVAGVTWALAWDATGVTPEAGGGWSTVTDQGYLVRVERGWALHWTAQLVPCADDAWWRAPSLGPRAAWANHGDEPEPSRVLLARVDDLGAPGAVVFDPVAFPAARYCAAHLAVAPPTPETAGRFTDREQGASLELSGRWSRGGREGRFDLRARWAHGAVVPLRVAEALPDGARARATIRRDLAGLFDGLDFDGADQSDQERAWRALSNLVERARVELTVEGVP